MPVAVFTVGSLGDILALLDKLWLLCSGIAGLSDLSDELKSLAHDVKQLTRTFEAIKSLLNATHSDVPLEDEVPIGLQIVADNLIACQVILETITSRVSAFNEQMGARGISLKTLRKCWAVAAWEILGGRNKVDLLLARLRSKVHVICAALNIEQSRSLEQVLTMARSQQASIDRLLTVAQEIAPSVRRIEASSFQFVDKKTGLPYLPCAKSPVEYIMHLFGTITIHDRAGQSLVTPSAGYAHQSLDGCRSNRLVGIAGGATLRSPAWDSSVQCYFYRECGIFLVHLGIAPVQARYNTSAMPALCRDIVMVGHATNISLYSEIKHRGDFVNRVCDVYREICVRCARYLVGSDQEQLLDLLKRFPDPASMEETVLPRVRQLFDRNFALANSSDPDVAFREFVRGMTQVHPPTDIEEVLSLVRDCPCLDPETVTRYELPENIKVTANPPLMWGISIECTDIAAKLVRAASRLPNFWK